MRDKLNVTVGDHACRMTLETLTSQSRAIIWSVCELCSATASNVPPAPATKEANVDCVAFFNKEEKGSENFRKKKKFRCKLKR